MPWFSEKFMEDCIAEAPQAFLNRPLQLKSQQRKLGAFIPDLIFTDLSGKSVIVEIQRSGLDRYHLYKCLEYRDLLANEEHCQPDVVLVCETLPSRYQGIVNTHNIEVHILDRNRIIEIAVTNCPQSLKSHLLRSQEESSFRSPPIATGSLRRYCWNSYDTLAGIYGFVLAELGRCGLTEKYIDNAQSPIICEARHLLDHRFHFDDLLDPITWRIDNLVTRPPSRTPPKLSNLTRIRKPKAEFHIFVTSKGNLSVRWYPKLDSGDHEIHDWIKLPETEPYSYQRPVNELLFVKDIHWLTPHPERYAYFKNGDDKEALNTMLLALVWGMIEHIKHALSATVELDVLNEFQLTVHESAEEEYSVTQRYELSGWRLIDTAALRAEEAEQRIAEFNEKNAVSMDMVLQTLKEVLSTPSRLKGDRPTYLAKALRLKGYKITATPIRQLLDDLALSEHSAYLPFLDTNEVNK